MTEFTFDQVLKFMTQISQILTPLSVIILAIIGRKVVQQFEVKLDGNLDKVVALATRSKLAEGNIEGRKDLATEIAVRAADKIKASQSAGQGP
jgi:hypothetical protein